MERPGKGRRNLVILTGLLVVACAGLAILMNIPFGPDHRIVALGFGPQVLPVDQGQQVDTVATATAAAGPFLHPNEKFEPGKLAPPALGCGMGDRYAVVCKDGSAHKGTYKTTCDAFGGFDYWLVCP